LRLVGRDRNVALLLLIACQHVLRCRLQKQLTAGRLQLKWRSVGGGAKIDLCGDHQMSTSRNDGVLNELKLLWYGRIIT